MKNIFVSSTFRDMQAERDLIQKELLPLLSARARQFGEYINMIDLRWGVDTSELESEEGAKKVLTVCLDEIDKSRPYMLIFLGNRYGSVMDEEINKRVLKKKGVDLKLLSYDLSVTAMEVEYGLLDRTLEEQTQCIVCVRNTDLSQIVDEKTRKIYEVESEAARRKQQLFKEKILACKGITIVPYECRWDEKNKQFTQFSCLDGSSLSSKLDEVYAKLFEEEWAAYESLDWWEKERRNNKELIDKKLKMYRGQIAFLNECYLQIAHPARANRSLVIQGTVGSGKTTLMCKLISSLELQGKPVFNFFSGSSVKSETATQLLEQLSHYLESYAKKHCKDYYEYFEEEPNSSYVLQLVRQVKHYADQLDRMVYIAVDALDQLKADDALSNFDFLVRHKRLRYFMSSTNDFFISGDTILTKGLIFAKVPSISPEAVPEIASGILASSSRNAYKEVLETIVKKKHSNNPLYISLIIQRLNMMGMRELFFANDEKKIIRLGIDIVKSMPDDIEKAVLKVFEDTYQELGKTKKQRDTYKNVIGLLVSSQRGLSTQQLMQILEANQNEITALDIARLTNYLDGFFVVHANGGIDFNHKIFRESIRKNYKMQTYQDMLVEYLLSCDQKDELFLSEGMYFASIGKDKKLAERIFSAADKWMQQDSAELTKDECKRKDMLFDSMRRVAQEDRGEFYVALLEENDQILAFMQKYGKVILGNDHSSRGLKVQEQIYKAVWECLCKKEPSYDLLPLRIMEAYEQLDALYENGAYIDTFGRQSEGKAEALFAQYKSQLAKAKRDYILSVSPEKIESIINRCDDWWFYRDENKCDWREAEIRKQLEYDLSGGLYWLGYLTLHKFVFLEKLLYRNANKSLIRKMSKDVVGEQLFLQRLDFNTHKQLDRVMRIYHAIIMNYINEPQKARRFFEVYKQLFHYVCEKDECGYATYLCMQGIKEDLKDIDFFLSLHPSKVQPFLLELKQVYESLWISSWKDDELAYLTKCATNCKKLLENSEGEALKEYSLLEYQIYGEHPEISTRNIRRRLMADLESMCTASPDMQEKYVAQKLSRDWNPFLMYCYYIKDTIISKVKPYEQDWQELKELMSELVNEMKEYQDERTKGGMPMFFRDLFTPFCWIDTKIWSTRSAAAEELLRWIEDIVAFCPESYKSDYEKNQFYKFSLTSLREYVALNYNEPFPRKGEDSDDEDSLGDIFDEIDSLLKGLL